VSRAQDTGEVIKSGIGLLLCYQGGPIDLKRANMIPPSTLVHMQQECCRAIVRSSEVRPKYRIT
jgi:hypothetical protein